MLEVENKTELLMLLIALDNSTDLILNDERAQGWHERAFTILYTRVAEEYAALANDEEEALIVALLT